MRRAQVALACLCLWHLIKLEASGSQKWGRQEEGPADWRSAEAWREFKARFAKSYGSRELDALHQTVFVRRLDVRWTLRERCRSEQPTAKWPRTLDEVRSTWTSHVEPTVRVFIERFERRHARRHASAEESELRRQLVELFLDQRRLLRACCRLNYERLAEEDETLDWSLEELKRLGKRDWASKLNSIANCNNQSGGPLQ